MPADRENSARAELLALLVEGDQQQPWQAALEQLSAQLSRLRELEHDFHRALLREKLEALRELAYGASHEINNPLANISSRAQTLLRDETDPERRRKLATINSQAFRAHEMIADMMLFAKPPELQLEPLDLNELARSVAGELEDRALEQGTELHLQLSERPCRLEGDRHHLTVAIKAVGQNALEAVVRGGVVTIASHSGEDTVVLAIEDTGPGIPPAIQRHMFDPFYSGREAGRGLGFGLPKCWRIVTLHGGAIAVQSADGLGARFTIQLPIQPLREANPVTCRAAEG